MFDYAASTAYEAWLTLTDLDGARHAFRTSDINRIYQQRPKRQPAFEGKAPSWNTIISLKDGTTIGVADTIDELVALISNKGKDAKR